MNSGTFANSNLLKSILAQNSLQRIPQETNFHWSIDEFFEIASFWSENWLVYFWIQHVFYKIGQWNIPLCPELIASNSLKKTFATKLLFQTYRNSSQGINSYRVHAGHIIWRWSYESVGCQDRENVPLAKRHIDGPKRDKHCKRHTYNCTPP